TASHDGAMRRIKPRAASRGLVGKWSAPATHFAVASEAASAIHRAVVVTEAFVHEKTRWHRGDHGRRVCSGPSVVSGSNGWERCPMSLSHPFMKTIWKQRDW